MDEAQWRAAWRFGVEAAECALLRMAEKAAPKGVGPDRRMASRQAYQHAADVLSLLAPDSTLLGHPVGVEAAAMEIIRRLRVMGVRGEDAQTALRTAGANMRVMEANDHA